LSLPGGNRTSLCMTSFSNEFLAAPYTLAPIDKDLVAAHADTAAA